MSLLGGGMAVPFAAIAQTAGKLRTIGFLGPTSQTVARQRVAAFEQRLQEHGWIKGQTVAIEYRWAEGNAERFEELAGDLVRLKVELIVTWGTATARAAKRATSVIPIVFTIVGDPVGSGLAESLAHPGGNVTGLSTQHDEAAGKRLQLLREMIPDLRRLALLANIGNSGDVLEMQAAEAAARTLAIEVIEVVVREADEIAPALQAVQGKAQALYVTGDALFNNCRDRINGLALSARLPTMHGFREIVAAGGLMSYGPKYLDLFRRAADYVDKILHGAQPSELPVEQPTSFELVINVKTANALGITLPQALLARADEVIE